MTPAIPKIAPSRLPDIKQPIEDTRHSIRTSEYGSVSRDTKTETDLCLHEDMLPRLNCEENGRQHHLGEEERPFLLPPKSESKPSNRKSLKKLCSFPCSKRSRKDHLNDSVMTAGADDHDAKKIGYDPLRCMSSEKCRIVKQKRGQDGKRIDKKSFKASVKAKYDPFTSKIGYIGSDSASGGNDINRIYGLKSVVNDVTRLVEEPSLDELFNGSYNYPSLSPEKGKKVSNGNSNVLLSVRNACSILPLDGAEDSGGNRKSLMSPQNTSLSSEDVSDSNVKDKCIEELSCEDAIQAVLSSSALYQPKDILEKLALPPTRDLDAFVLNLYPSQSNTHKKDFRTSSLPPFAWSFSHGVTSKPGIDSCKLNLPRTSQSKWVRIKGTSTLTGDDSNCFDKFDLGKLDIELKTLDLNDDCAQERQTDELQNVKSLTEYIMPDKPEHTSDCHTLFKGSGESSVLNFRKKKLPNEHADVSDNYIEYDSKGNIFRRNSESKVFLENELVDYQNSPSKETELHPVYQHKKTTDVCSGSCYDYHCKSLAGRCDQFLWQSPAPEMSRPVLSQKLLAAAKILCEMANSSIASSAQMNNYTRMISPTTPPGKNTRDRKSQSSLEKTERLAMPSRHHDAFKRTGLPSTKHKLMSEKKNDYVHTSNTGREPVRWSLPTEVGSSSPRHHERNHITTNHRPRFEKVHNHHHKLGKETLKAACALGGTCIKDWNRGRSKKV